MQRLAPIALFTILALPSMATGANVAKISPRELAQAINRADARSVPYTKAKISPADIRISKCIGPDEEPTEFECTWRQRSDHWALRKTWLAIDSRGWRVID